jgi:hypothetical protein
MKILYKIGMLQRLEAIALVGGGCQVVGQFSSLNMEFSVDT